MMVLYQEIYIKNCKADAVFSKSDALDILHQAILEGIICVSSEAIGAMETCYKLTIEYTHRENNLVNLFQNFKHCNTEWLICSWKQNLVNLFY